MSNKETGGTAFPISPHQLTEIFSCMTLRDYFAANALVAVSYGLQKIGCDFVHPQNHLATAKTAYEIADAMIKARES
jgi:hypothetical protein